MAEPVRVLSEEGSRRFREYVTRLRRHGEEPPPLSLLMEDRTSEAAGFDAEIKVRNFASRVEFGRHLVATFRTVERRRISRAAGLWNWLALRFFDQLCPPDAMGIRRPLDPHHYVLEGGFAHNRYYRHLVRAAWYAIALHGDDGAILLASSDRAGAGVGQWGEISEQLFAYQDILGNRTAIVVASRLYLDDHGGLKRGAASRDGPGSVRRLTAVLRQLSLTHDLRSGSPEAVLDMLPPEFDRFRGDRTLPPRRGSLRRPVGQPEARP